MYCVMQYDRPPDLVAELRLLLPNLHRPDKLDTPRTRELLRAHGRIPANPSSREVGVAAAALLTDKIAGLKAPADATWAQRLPHSVLETCFVKGHKSVQAAQELGVSERQLSRERTRALELLASTLAPRAITSVSPDRIPPTDGHLDREDLVRQVASALTKKRSVTVTGRPATGKTSVVATLARLVRDDQVWWVRIRRGLNDCLESFLLELGRTLARDGYPPLLDYLLAALPRPNLATATRLSLEGIALIPRLLVLDDFDSARHPEAIRDFLNEAVERVGTLSVITIGSALTADVVVEVPPLSRVDLDRLMNARNVSWPSSVLDTLHTLAAGRPGVISAAAAWCSNDGGAREKVTACVAARGPLAGLVGVVNFIAR